MYIFLLYITVTYSYIHRDEGGYINEGGYIKWNMINKILYIISIALAVDPKLEAKAKPTLLPAVVCAFAFAFAVPTYRTVLRTVQHCVPTYP